MKLTSARLRVQSPGKATVTCGEMTVPCSESSSTMKVAGALAVGATSCGGGGESGTPVLKWYAKDEAGGVFGAGESAGVMCAQGSTTRAG